VPRIDRRTPSAGELWLSRPPYTFLTRVRVVRRVGDETRIEYELLDHDGWPLSGPFREVLDSSWWRNFQPLVRRVG
jgi:hypothetical protein